MPYYPLEETSNGVISSKNTDFLLEMCEKSSAVVIGCGLSVCDDTKNLVQSVITNCEKPLVIDADALNCICNKPEFLKNLKAPAIITPHPGEMARLLPRAAPAVEVFFLLSGYQNRLSIRSVYSMEFLLDGIRAVTPQQCVV